MNRDSDDDSMHCPRIEPAANGTAYMKNIVIKVIGINSCFVTITHTLVLLCGPTGWFAEPFSQHV